MGTQGGGELCDRGEAVPRFLGETALNHRRELGGHVRAHPIERGRLGLHHHHAKLGDALGGERDASRDELVQDGAQRPDVRATVDVLGRAQLLGRNVVGEPITSVACVRARSPSAV